MSWFNNFSGAPPKPNGFQAQNVQFPGFTQWNLSNTHPIRRRNPQQDRSHPYYPQNVRPQTLPQRQNFRQNRSTPHNHNQQQKSPFGPTRNSRKRKEYSQIMRSETKASPNSNSDMQQSSSSGVSASLISKEKTPHQETVRKKPRIETTSVIDLTDSERDSKSKKSNDNLDETQFNLELMDATYQDVFSTGMWQYFVENRQSDSTYQSKQQFCDALRSIVCAPFPHSKLLIVGSSLNGFGTNKADMDLCLWITDSKIDQKQGSILVLENVKMALIKCPFVSRVQLIRAKVPILKFYRSNSQLECDLNVNNEFGVFNTHLLAMYSRLDWRVRPLVMFVKHWAVSMDIHDASRGRLSSYSLVLMLIHYLQVCDPPILPSLQRSYPQQFSYQRNSVVDYQMPLPAEVRTNQNTATLLELFHGFIRYFDEKFDYDGSAISVRLGKSIPLHVALSQLSPNERQHAARSMKIFVEEPFSLLNTAHSHYEAACFARTKNAFRKTNRLLHQRTALVDILSEPV